MLQSGAGPAPRWNPRDLLPCPRPRPYGWPCPQPGCGGVRRSRGATPGRHGPRRARARTTMRRAVAAACPPVTEAVSGSQRPDAPTRGALRLVLRQGRQRAPTCGRAAPPTGPGTAPVSGFRVPPGGRSVCGTAGTACLLHACGAGWLARIARPSHTRERWSCLSRRRSACPGGRRPPPATGQREPRPRLHERAGGRRKTAGPGRSSRPRRPEGRCPPAARAVPAVPNADRAPPRWPPERSAPPR